MERVSREQVEAVQRMLDHIEANLGDLVSLEELAKVAGYSRFHALRLFEELVGLQPGAYVRARRLSEAALRLRGGQESVASVAWDAAFHSHEGFSRAFSRRFGVSPSEARPLGTPLPLYLARGVRDIHLHRQGVGLKVKSTVSVFVRPVLRPERVLVLRRGRFAEEYWGFSEEVGCDLWGILTSLGKGAWPAADPLSDTPSDLGEPMGLWLPESLRRPGTSTYVAGVEVPVGFSFQMPEGMESISLPACHYLFMQGPPYAADRLGEAVAEASAAFDAFDLGVAGLVHREDAPRYQLGPLPERGYIEGRPVRALRGG